MRWHDWLGCGLIGCGVAVSGCVTTDQTPKPALDLTQFNETDCYGVNVARAAQPDGDTAIGPKSATNLQDAPPQDVGNLIINGVPAARIRATVNTDAITDEEVKAACYPLLRPLDRYPEPERSQKQLEVFKETLEQIIQREVVLQVAFARLRKVNGETAVKKLMEAADKEFDKQWVKPIMEGNHIKTDADFKAALAQMNISLPMMKRQWTRNYIAMEFMRQMVYGGIERDVDHLALKDYYERHPEEFQIADSVQWEDIFVSEALHAPRAVARQRADLVLSRLRKGEPINALLNDKLDDGDSSLRDGRGLGRKHGEIKPAEAEGPLFQLNDGEATVVEISSGYHVVRVVKREHAGMVSLDDKKVQKQIREKLRNEIGQREIKKLAESLRKEAVVEYFSK